MARKSIPGKVLATSPFALVAKLAVLLCVTLLSAAASAQTLTDFFHVDVFAEHNTGSMCAQIGTAITKFVAANPLSGLANTTTIFDAGGFTGSQVCLAADANTMLTALQGPGSIGGILKLGNVAIYIQGPAGGAVAFQDGNNPAVIGTPAIILPTGMTIEGIGRGGGGLNTLISPCTSSVSQCTGINFFPWPQRLFAIGGTQFANSGSYGSSSSATQCIPNATTNAKTQTFCLLYITQTTTPFILGGNNNTVFTGTAVGAAGTVTLTTTSSGVFTPPYTIGTNVVITGCLTGGYNGTFPIASGGAGTNAFKYTNATTGTGTGCSIVLQTPSVADFAGANIYMKAATGQSAANTGEEVSIVNTVAAPAINARRYAAVAVCTGSGTGYGQGTAGCGSSSQIAVVVPIGTPAGGNSTTCLAPCGNLQFDTAMIGLGASRSGSTTYTMQMDVAGTSAFGHNLRDFTIDEQKIQGIKAIENFFGQEGGTVYRVAVDNMDDIGFDTSTTNAQNFGPIFNITTGVGTAGSNTCGPHTTAMFMHGNGAFRTIFSGTNSANTTCNSTIAGVNSTVAVGTESASTVTMTLDAGTFGAKFVIGSDISISGCGSGTGIAGGTETRYNGMIGKILTGGSGFGTLTFIAPITGLGQSKATSGDCVVTDLANQAWASVYLDGGDQVYQDGHCEGYVHCVALGWNMVAKGQVINNLVGQPATSNAADVVSIGSTFANTDYVINAIDQNVSNNTLCDNYQLIYNGGNACITDPFLEHRSIDASTPTIANGFNIITSSASDQMRIYNKFLDSCEVTNTSSTSVPTANTFVALTGGTCQILVGSFNRVPRTLEIRVAGTYTSAVAAAQQTFKVLLCTTLVAGTCSGGTIVTLLNMTNGAVTGATVAAGQWTIDGRVSTTTAGTSAVFEPNGELRMQLATPAATVTSSIFTATSSLTGTPIDITGTAANSPLFIQIQGAFTTTQANTMTVRQMNLRFLN